VNDASEPGDSIAMSLDPMDAAPNDDLLYVFEEVAGYCLLFPFFDDPMDMMISGLIVRFLSLVDDCLLSPEGSRCSTT
jgi:hypothetical protein